MQISSKKFERAPSIRQLFPPKNHDGTNGCETCSVQFINPQCNTSKSQFHQCYSSKPLLLEDVARTPRNSISSIPSHGMEHTVSMCESVDRSSTFVIPSIQVEHLTSSESSPITSPTFGKFNLLTVILLKNFYSMIHYFSILDIHSF